MQQRGQHACRKRSWKGMMHMDRNQRALTILSLCIAFCVDPTGLQHPAFSSRHRRQRGCGSRSVCWQSSKISASWPMGDPRFARFRHVA